MSFFDKAATTVNNLFHIFDRISSQETAVQKLSQVEGDKQVDDLKNSNGPPLTILNYYQQLYAPCDTNKSNRLRIYRQMSTLPEVSDAFDEVCDAFLNTDESGDFIYCKYSKYCKLDTEAKEKIQKEFYKFVSLFDFPRNTYGYMQSFLTDGELAFENIINVEKTHLGIVGVRELQNENYEFLRNEATLTTVGLFYRSADLNEFSVSSAQSPTVFGKIRPPGFLNTLTSLDTTKLNEGIPLPFAQVTYINTGNYAPGKKFVYSMLEKIRKVYVQLTLLEDCAITYRIARSPVRFVFNVAVGNLPRARAEQELAKIALRFQTKKGASVQAPGQIYNKYDSINALESFFFAKPANSEGTTVTTLDKTADFGQLDDIKYFVKKLYLGLKVPYARVDEPNVEIKVSPLITYEEYRFAKYLIRIQNAFASGMQYSFKVHLYLTGIWDELSLHDRDLIIEFGKPSNYDLYMEQQLAKGKSENYGAYADKPEFSRKLLMKKFLKWSDAEIHDNFQNVVDEKLFDARLEAKVKQISGEEPSGDIFSGGGGESSPMVGGSPTDTGAPDEPPTEPEPGAEGTPEPTAETPAAEAPPPA